MVCYLLIEMKCTLVRFPRYVIGSSLSEIVKSKCVIGSRLSEIVNLSDVDRGADCGVDGPAKFDIKIKFDWLLI